MKRALSKVDKALSYDDYKSIMDCVPSITRGTLPWLQHEIRAAAAWYVIEVKIDADAKPAEDKAVLMKLAKHLGEAFIILTKLNPASRIRLVEQVISEESKKALVEREAALLGQEYNLPPEVVIDRLPGYDLTPAMRYPIERVFLKELKRISRLARKAADSIDTGGRRPRTDRGLAILMKAWSDATGRSPFSDACEEFLIFARKLTRTLQERGWDDVDNPSRRQMDNAQAHFRTKKRSY